MPQRKVPKGSPEASRATAPSPQMLNQSDFCTWTWYTTAARDPAGQQAAAGWYTDLMVNLIVLRGAQTVANTLSVRRVFLSGRLSPSGKGVPVQEGVLGEMSAKMLTLSEQVAPHTQASPVH